jgi:hypothetical protein
MTNQRETPGGNTATEELKSCLNLAAAKARQLLGALDRGAAPAQGPTPAEVLPLVEELRASIGEAAEAGKNHGHYETLWDTQCSAQALAQFLASAQTLDSRRIRMDAKFLDCRLSLLAAMAAREK